MLSRNRISAPSSRGFSLVELLVVMAILVVMLSLAGPAMNALKGANDVNQAAADLSGILEQARAYAMANNTFTYVGFYQDKSDGFKTKLAVFASQDGTRQLKKTDGTSNLQQVSRVKILENAKFAKLDAYPDDYENAKRPTDSAVVEKITDSNKGITLSTTGSNSINFDYVLRFGPNGLAQADNLQPDQPDSPKGYYEIALKQTRGQTEMPNNSAVVQVSGLTGSVQVYRPTVK
jgi:prepilin-type N-terminal cleavage/methylation domain-containing protein